MVFCAILLAITACSRKPIAQSAKISVKPLEKDVFIMRPFGYEPTIKNFRTNLPSSFKLQVYSMKNIHNPSVIDTIYKFYQKKSELLIYKNSNKRELFFAGNIYNHKIQLRNGVRVGMSRDEFFRCFENFKPRNDDTIRISSKRAINSINFIFKGNKLKVIKIDNYID
jgi:hypothetical protein